MALGRVKRSEISESLSAPNFTEISKSDYSLRMRKVPALFLFLTVMLSTFCGKVITDEKHTFRSNVDEFLGKIADGVSK